MHIGNPDEDQAMPSKRVKKTPEERAAAILAGQEKKLAAIARKVRKHGGVPAYRSHVPSPLDLFIGETKTRRYFVTHSKPNWYLVTKPEGRLMGFNVTSRPIMPRDGIVHYAGFSFRPDDHGKLRVWGSGTAKTTDEEGRERFLEIREQSRQGFEALLERDYLPVLPAAQDVTMLETLVRAVAPRAKWRQAA